ncbi:WecB/TagA/CpsF family glycosyltransferase [Virgibacillus flavescens]|uniref:WecB/TagA/CpsF family glycosyltransferase n=1 Tax=Virgibacillus flavescens TaxID=1611422 RepID=UPI003D327128
MNKNVSIMDVSFLNTTQREFLDSYIFPALKRQERCFVVTANPEIVMKTREDQDYKKAINKADYVIPDGIGIIMAAKFMKQPLQERVAGSDLTFELLEYAERQGLSCYFLGATEEVNKKVVANITQQYPKLKIAGRHHGFFDMEDAGIVDEVKHAHPDIVFTALGLPRQEKWIASHVDQFEKGLFIGIGGVFDIIAGELKRAPAMWIRLNLEWLYRLIKQPWRFMRILKVFEFMLRVVLRR